jgi:hypothetical protein
MYNIRLASPSDPHFPVRLPSLLQVTRSWRFWFTALLALVACGSMIRAAFFLRAQSPDELLDHGVAWAAFGTLAFGLALWFARSRIVLPVAVPTVKALEGTGLSGRFLIPGLLLMALVTEMSAKLLGIDALYGAGPAVQFGLLCVALVLLARGLGGAIPRPTLRGWQRALPLIGILVLALAVRLIWLDSSVHTLIDESQDLSGMQFLWTHPTDGLLKAASIYLPTTMV